MRELQADEEVARRAVFGSRERNHPLERREVVFRQQQLTGIGACVGIDRDRLTPEQLGPAAGEAGPAAERQLVGSAIERAVAAFHRVNHQAVTDAAPSNRQRGDSDANVRFETDRYVEIADLLFKHRAIGKQGVAGHYFTLSASRIPHPGSRLRSS
jgi:hypothetical protein